MEIVATNQAPAAIGPYSQAVKTGNLLFTSGQIAIDPANGEVVSGGIAEQTAQIMKNLSAVLAAAGVSFDAVVKTTCFLALRILQHLMKNMPNILPARQNRHVLVWQ